MHDLLAKRILGKKQKVRGAALAAPRTLGNGGGRALLTESEHEDGEPVGPALSPAAAQLCVTIS